MLRRKGGFQILLAISLLALANIFCGGSDSDQNRGESSSGGSSGGAAETREAAEMTMEAAEEAVASLTREAEAAAAAARAADAAAEAARAAEEAAQAARDAEDEADVTRAAEVAEAAAREAEAAAEAARAAEESARAAEQAAEATRIAEEAAAAQQAADEAALAAEEAARAAEEAAEATRQAQEAAGAGQSGNDSITAQEQQLACPGNLADAGELPFNTETDPIPTSDECWYRVNVPAGIGLMTVELEAQSGEFDLYLESGQANSAADVINAGNQLNFTGPIEEERTYAYSDPFGNYTLAVSPIGAGTFDLRVGLGALGSAGDVSSCEASACISVFSFNPLLQLGIVHIGSDFGDRVIFPIEVACEGPIEAEAHWSGSAQQLALILNGPGQVGYFDRSDGLSGIRVQHTVTAANVQNGSQWFVTLTNFNGGEATGRVEISYPSCEGGGSGSLAPALSVIGSEDYEANGRQWTRYLLSVTNWASYPAEFFQAAPHLPPCGSNNNAARAWVNIYNASNDQRIYGFCALGSPESLTNLWFAVERGTRPPSGVYIVIDDRETGRQYVSNVVRP